jgi:dipeptidyl aminopeptidase/acylaminoacyl peptidase
VNKGGFSISGLLISILLFNNAYCQTIFFKRGGAIWSSNIDGQDQHQALKIDRGSSDYAISPSGDRLAFTKASERYRSIGWYDMKLRTPKIFVEKRNCFGPTWSPDGSELAFYWLDTLDAQPRWNIAIVDTSLTNFVDLAPKGSPIDFSFFPFCWYPNSSGIVVEVEVRPKDTHVLQTYNQKGDLVNTEDFFFPGKDTTYSGLIQFALSPNGSLLAIVTSVIDDGSKNFVDYFGESDYSCLVLYDLQTNTFRRLTPKNMSVGSTPPVWSPNSNSIIISAIEAARPLKENSNVKSNIYRLSTDQKSIQLVITDGTDPSVANNSEGSR